MNHFKFNFKKRYFLLIFILIILFFNHFNVKAATIVQDSTIVLNDASDYFSKVWNLGSIDDAISLNYNDYIDDLYDELKNKAVVDTNSLDFDDFTNNYYYAIVCSFNKYNNTTKRAVLNLYYISKEDNIPFKFYFNFYSSSTFSSSTTRLYGVFGLNIGTASANIYGVQQNSDGSNYVTSSSGFNYTWEFRKGSSGTYYESFSYNNDIFSTSIENFLIKDSFSIFNAFYIDSNVNKSLYFGNLGSGFVSSSNYIFENMTRIYNDSEHNSITDNFTTDDKIFNSISYISPNIQNLGDNSYGIGTNYLSVSFNKPPTSDSVVCPYDRPFDNNICYIYNSDITFNTDNLHFFNIVDYYVDSNGSIPIRENYYYILTIRIYSPYSLSINQLRLSSGNFNFPTNIEKVVVNDFYTYKDYQIVFTPNITGSLTPNFIQVFFDDYDTLISDIPSDLSFGAFNFIKYSEFSSLPSDSDITSDYTKNNLNTISTNSSSSFFNNFKVNDRGLSQIVLLPLGFLRSMLSSTCNPVSLPIPHSNLNAQLPCLSSIFSIYFGSFWSLFQVILNGVIYYRICLSLFSILKNFYNVQNNEIEVIDL